MKKILTIIVQFVFYLILDVIGSLFYQPFQIKTALAGSSAAPRTFIWDGLILAVLGYVLVIIIASLRKKLDSSAPWATLALVLAALAGYVLKLGFVTQNW